MEIIPWGQTIDRWHQEGLPESANAGQMFVGGNEYFGLDGIEVIDVDLLPPYPRRDDEILAEDDRMVLFIDEFGRKRRALKEGTSHGFRLSMDHYLEWPVKTRADFAEYKKGYAEETIPMRYPEEWDRRAALANASELPVSLLDPMVGTFGFYSMLRNFMGTENLSYMFYDDPLLVKSCLQMLSDYALKAFKRVVNEVNLDYYILHEDMCYKAGPLVSPETFKEFFMPHYITFIDFLKGNGVKHIMMDTDGNFLKLLPMFIDAGIDSISPCECAAGMDVVELRKQYPTLGLMGGIDKREVAKGGKHIDEEVRYKIGSIIDKGRYIPMIDHSIPPDVSLENFEHYLNIKRKYMYGL
jgi:uroporphyrinogen decarboxylase